MKTLLEKEKSSVLLATKNMKIELKKEFPSCIFDIRTTNSHISIQWIDGAALNDVKPIVKRYEKGSQSYKESTFHKKFGGANYVFIHRKITNDFKYRVAKENGIDVHSNIFPAAKEIKLIRAVDATSE